MSSQRDDWPPPWRSVFPPTCGSIQSRIRTGRTERGLTATASGKSLRLSFAAWAIIFFQSSILDELSHAALIRFNLAIDRQIARSSLGRRDKVGRRSLISRSQGPRSYNAFDTEFFSARRSCLITCARAKRTLVVWLMGVRLMAGMGSIWPRYRRRLVAGRRHSEMLRAEQERRVDRLVDRALRARCFFWSLLRRHFLAIARRIVDPLFLAVGERNFLRERQADAVTPKADAKSRPSVLYRQKQRRTWQRTLVELISQKRTFAKMHQPGALNHSRGADRGRRLTLWHPLVPRQFFSLHVSFIIQIKAARRALPT